MAISHPSDISGLLADYDPHEEAYQDSGGTTPAGDGDPVGNVPDQQGSYDAIIQATAGNRPDLTADGNGWLYIDYGDTSDAESLGNTTFQPPSSGAQPFTIVVVSANKGTSTIDGLAMPASGGYIHRDSRDYQLNFGTNLRGGTPDTSRHVHHVEVDGSSSVIYIDNSSVASGNAGSNAWGAGFSQGDNIDVYRVLVYDSILSSADRTDLYDYLDDLYSNAPPSSGAPDFPFHHYYSGLLV